MKDTHQCVLHWRISLRPRQARPSLRPCKSLKKKKMSIKKFWSNETKLLVSYCGDRSYKKERRRRSLQNYSARRVNCPTRKRRCLISTGNFLWNVCGVVGGW